MNNVHGPLLKPHATPLQPQEKISRSTTASTHCKICMFLSAKIYWYVCKFTMVNVTITLLIYFTVDLIYMHECSPEMTFST